MDIKEGQKYLVRSSHCVTLRAKYLGNSGRIAVARYESNSAGIDPQRVIVAWNSGEEIHENYERAFSVYLERAGWAGIWVSSIVTDGAVCVCMLNRLG